MKSIVGDLYKGKVIDPNYSRPVYSPILGRARNEGTELLVLTCARIRDEVALHISSEFQRMDFSKAAI
jgi:hypothetical protein